jgi:hypothetical protein
LDIGLGEGRSRREGYSADEDLLIVPMGDRSVDRERDTRNERIITESRLGMRRGFHLKIAFQPTRLSAEHLRNAYEVVIPITERSISREGGDTEFSATSRNGDGHEDSSVVRTRLVGSAGAAGDD